MLTELTVWVQNEPNKLREILSALSVVNIQAFGIEEAYEIEGKIRFITDDPAAAECQLKNLGIKKYKLRTIFGIALDHKPGQLIKVVTHLGERGINIEHGFLTYDITKKKAIVILKTSEDKESEAETLLKEAGFELCDIIEEPLKALATPLTQELNIHPKGQLSRLKNLINTGESGYTEFKATFKYDIKTHIVNKELGTDLCVSIAAFMNTRGGSLLIGVNDDGSLRGVKEDFKVLGQKQNEDEFRKQISNLICSEIGEKYNDYIDQYFINIDGFKIYIIEVSVSSKPVWINNERELPIRVGPTDRRLTGKKASDYHDSHWGKNVKRRL